MRRYDIYAANYCDYFQPTSVVLGQRERRKLELQSKALLLREKQAKTILEKLETSRHAPPSSGEVLEKIKEIYGLSNPPRAVATP